MPAANERILHHNPEGRQSGPVPVDFSVGVDRLAQSLLGRQVVLLDGETQQASVQFTVVEPYGLTETNNHQQIGERYKRAFAGVVEPGMVLAPVVRRGIRQTLISAVDGEEKGACVRVHRASRIDLQTGEAHPMKNEGDVALALGFMRNEILQLRQSENPNILHLTPTGQIYDSKSRGSQNFSEDMERFFGEFFEPEE